MSRIYCYVKQVLFYLFLVAYILVFAKSLLFKQVSPFELFDAGREVTRTINLIPFKETLEYFSSERFNIWIALMNIAGNIILFIPLGLYLQIFKRNKHVSNSVAIVCATSLCVEVTQYIFGIGFTDIDDIILNTTGGLLGVLIYRIIYSLLKDRNTTRTAVTFLFCLAFVCLFAYYLVLTKLFGMIIKIW